VAATSEPADMAESDELQAEVEFISTERLVFFSDAVVAIAITLLALGLPEPQGANNADLLHSARGYLTEYLAFGISFVVIAAYWRGHHAVFRYVARVGPILRWNLLWLFFIVTMPFATKVLSGDNAFQARFIFYASIQVLTSLSFILILQGLNRHDLLRAGSPPHLVRNSMLALIVLSIAFLISMPLSLLTPWAYLCWVAVPLVNRVVRRFTNRISPL
jgi:uncharacterized membrane protein